MIIRKTIKGVLGVAIVAGTDILVASVVRRNIPETTHAVGKACALVAGAVAGMMAGETLAKYAGDSIDTVADAFVEVEKVAKNASEVKGGGEAQVQS